MADSVRLDHVVQLAASPAEAASRLEAFGLQAFAGGRHAAWGTENALVPLQDAYLEFLAVEDADVAAKSAFGRSVQRGLLRGDGLWRLALATQDMAAALRRLKTADIAWDGPIRGERLRPDGSRLGWQLAFPQGPKDAGTPPMLIAWDDPALAPYASPGAETARIELVAVAASDPLAAARWYEAAFGIAAQGVQSPRYGAAWRLELPAGDILICDGGARELWQLLSNEGPGPFAVHLCTAKGDRQAEIAIGRGRYLVR